MYNKTTTDLLANLPNRSKLRPLSIASITLLQLINSPVLDTLLNGGDIDLSKSLDLLIYLFIHTQDEKKVIDLCLNYAEDPTKLKSEVMLWSVTLSDEEFAKMVADLILDKDSIKNNQFEIDNDTEAEESGKKKALIKRLFHCLFGWLLTSLKIPGGRKK